MMAVAPNTAPTASVRRAMPRDGRSDCSLMSPSFLCPNDAAAIAEAVITDSRFNDHATQRMVGQRAEARGRHRQFVDARLARSPARQLAAQDGRRADAAATIAQRRGDAGREL